MARPNRKKKNVKRRQRDDAGLTSAQIEAAEKELKEFVDEPETNVEDQFAAALIAWHTADGSRNMALTRYRRYSELKQEREPFVKMYARAKQDLAWYEWDLARILLSLDSGEREDFLDSDKRHVIAGTGNAVVPEELAEALRDKVKQLETGDEDALAAMREINAEDSEEARSENSSKQKAGVK